MKNFKSKSFGFVGDDTMQPESSCLHVSTFLVPTASPDDFKRRCLNCTMSRPERVGKGKNAAPSHYLRRSLAFDQFWRREEWTAAMRPLSRIAGAWIISRWNASCKAINMAVEYKLDDVDLVCSTCEKIVQQTYKGGKCFDCHVEERQKEMVCSKCGVYVKKFANQSESFKNDPGLCQPCFAAKVNFTVAKSKAMGINPVAKPLKPILIMKPAVIRKEGDIWKLPTTNSPMWTHQWCYQGSGKAPYIISHRTDGNINGSVTSEGWACSCPNFTQHTPRTECKHILKVMMSEGFSPAKAKAVMADVDDEQLKAFKRWQMEQAAAGKSVLKPEDKKGKLNLFENNGRKFR